MDSFAEEVAVQVIALGQAAGVPLLVTLALLLVSSVLLVVARRLPGIRLPAPKPEVPAPPAQWNQDPSQGAVVVPNDDPGGCGDGSRCGG